MAELELKDGTYRNVPVYECFDYIADNNGFVYLSPVWTSAGLLVPIAHSATPAYMRIPREECVKMLSDLLDLNTFCKIFRSTNKKSTKD